MYDIPNLYPVTYGTCPLHIVDNDVYQVSRKFSKGFRETDLNIRVDAWVVANVDGRTNGRETESLYRAMHEAGASINPSLLFSFLLKWSLHPRDLINQNLVIFTAAGVVPCVGRKTSSLLSRLYFLVIWDH